MQGLQRTAIASSLLGILVACGGQPAVGPSPVSAAPPPGTVAAPAAALAPRPIPAWVDPALRGTLLVVDDAGGVRHWAGGAFHHCLAPSIDRDVVEPILAEMTALSGIPRTESGPCNVTWSAEGGTGGHSYASLSGREPGAILSAEVFLYHGGAMTARHEAGHVLGFGHSARREDLMNASPRVDVFSRDELAVLAWIYEGES